MTTGLIKRLITLFILILPAFPSFALDTNMPSSPVKLIFIHHSTGGNWLADQNADQPYGELGKALMNNNYYASATNYGWGSTGIGDSTDIPNWPQWFTGTDSTTILAELYAETGQNFGGFGTWSRLSSDPGGENQIIMFKSCFPNSDLYGNPTDQALSEPDDQFTVANAKAVYNKILTYFQTRQDKLFIVITAPPQNQAEYSSDYQTPADRAANARAFNNWLLNDWLDNYTYNNVGVFDYFNVLTGADNHHRISNNQIEHVTATSNNFAYYPTDSSYDSHPNSQGQQKATLEFLPILNYYYNTWKSGGTPTDTTAPLITTTSPSANQTDIATNTSISATFSEALSETTIDQNSFTVNDGTQNISGTVSYASSTATFTPTSSLSYNTTYTATLTTAVSDLAGNNLASNYQWSFTTGSQADTTAPTVQSVQPTSDQENVALTTTISITFSENIKASTATQSSLMVSDASGNSIDVGISCSGATATLTPSAPLASQSTYTVTISTSVTDEAGNPIGDQYSWSFTTMQSSDPTQPTTSGGGDGGGGGGCLIHTILGQ